MFKNILVFLDGGPEMHHSLQVAAGWARSSGGRVRGLFVKRLGLNEMAVMPPGPELGTGAPLMIDPEVLAAFDAGQEQLAGKVADIFHTQAGEYSGGLQVGQGDVVEELIRASHTADLVVMGRGRAGEQAADSWISEVTRRVLKRSWAPILLPAGGVEDILAGPYLLGYDGSAAANRVMRQITRLAAHTGAELTVVAVGNADVTAERLEEVQAYVQVSKPQARLEAYEGKPPMVLRGLIEARDFSLVALGAHGHSRLRDILLGTTTEELLRSTAPAFLICAL